MAPEERRKMLSLDWLARLTPHTITSQRGARGADRGRRAGRIRLALSRNSRKGSTPFAAPVRDHTGGVIAALSVSGPVYRFTEERMREVTPEVVAAAAAISQRMGHLD